MNPVEFEKGCERAIYLLVDPLGEGLFVDALEGAADAILASKRLHAEQACHDGIARQGGHVGVAMLADEDRVDDGGVAGELWLE